MEKRTKLIILAVATVGVILLLRKKANAQTQSGENGQNLSVTDRSGAIAFSRDGEETTYNALKALIKDDIGWVVPIAIENYNSGKIEYTINGKKDMAVALGVTIFQSSINPAGRFTRPGFPDTTKFLWSEDTLTKVHILYTNHRARYL